MFLNGADPTDWPTDKMNAMLQQRLALTTQEAVARLHQDWGTDINTYDQVHLQILQIADVLSNGIFHQFPKFFV